MPSRTVSASEIARILAGQGHDPLTKMAISQFVKEGMPKAARGMYDVSVCTYWYLGRLRTNVTRKATESADGKTLTLDEAQRRLTTAKAESEEMTLAVRRGELVPLAIHESTLTSLVQITKLRMLNLPSRLAPKLEGCSQSETKALLTAAIKDALAELARAAPDEPGHPKPKSKPKPRKRKPVPKPTSRAASKPRARKR